MSTNINDRGNGIRNGKQYLSDLQDERDVWLAGEKVKAFDVVHVIAIEDLVGVTRRLDRHAIARQHVKMRGPRKRLDRRFDRQQRRLDQ